MSLLKVDKVSKDFGGKPVVREVSLSVDKGKVVGLLGPNGAGKTTTFYMVVGLVKPTTGSIYFKNEDIKNFPIHKRALKGLSYLPQEASVFRRLTVYGNLMIALESTSLGKRERISRMEKLIEEFSLQKVIKSYGYMLSGGERRRVEIARALCLSPNLLLLDEPFAGIDPLAVQDIQGIIIHLRSQGMGVLITDHNVRETLGICDMAYILRGGEIQMCGSPQEIASSPEAKSSYLGENFKL